MVEHRRGKIIALSGGGSAAPRPNFSAYAASKTAVVRFIETLAEEVRDYNVQANCHGSGRHLHPHDWTRSSTPESGRGPRKSRTPNGCG